MSASDLTFNMLIANAIARAEEERTAATTQPEARDLSLSITHLEDARTRYNSSRYRRKGAWQIHDPDLELPRGAP
jgi:hypothetical protein